MSDPRRFHNFWWCIGDIAGWFVDRDRAKFGRIATPDDLPPLIFEDDSEARERRPDTRLLREFEKGLVAYDPHTGPIAPETWLFKSEGDIKAAFLRGVCCKRDDVLARCPAPVSRPEEDGAGEPEPAAAPAEASLTAPAPHRRRGRPPRKILETADKMRKALAEGSHTLESLSHGDDALAAEFGVKSRDTIRSARNIVKPEFVGKCRK